MRFRPCIDLHQGKVKQIVGGTLRDDSEPSTNFVSAHPPAYYARLYRDDGLEGGHVIMLGPGNEEAATEALGAAPGWLQVGGGINADNAPLWLERGASGVIVTSYVFREGRVDLERLRQLVTAVGRERLILDLSCRKRDGRYWIVTDRWQRFTEAAVNRDTLAWLAEYCAEFLVHAVDVEGLRQGIDEELVEILAEGAEIPTTYAGGVRSLEDLERIHALGAGRIDATVGSALDLFGGTLPYRDVVALDRQWRAGS